MSGTASASWSLVQDPVHYAVQLAAQLNCSLPRNMLQHHSQIISCLRAKPLSDLYSVQLTAPSFLIAMGPSRDGVLIPSDFGTTVVSFGKRSASPVFRVILGVTENEARDLFSEEELENGINSREKDRLLRTLVRNTYTYHLNEIYYTVQNEYSNYQGREMTPRETRSLVSSALNDKLYISPVLETAAWCNQSGYSTYLYIQKVGGFHLCMLHILSHLNIYVLQKRRTAMHSKYLVLQNTGENSTVYLILLHLSLYYES